MRTPTEELLQSSRLLIEAIRSERSDHLLPTLLLRRGERIRVFAAALQQGTVPSAAEAQELQRLDSEMVELVARQRAKAGAELAGLHRRRTAGRAYHASRRDAPRFLDKES
jgi:hypothetical protein